LGFSSGGREERVPTPDGGQEVVSARFIHPKDAITELREGKLTFMPPQYYLLWTLASILQGRENTSAQRDQVATLSSGPFGQMVVNPQMMTTRDKQGRIILTFEGDETRGGFKGRLHRILMGSSKDVGLFTLSVFLSLKVFPRFQTKLFSSVTLTFLRRSRNLFQGMRSCKKSFEVSSIAQATIEIYLTFATCRLLHGDTG